jgi:hypothetical protein
MARILNADGYTSLFNPTEYPETNPGSPALRYIPGKLAPGGDLSSTLMPYIAYGEDEPRCVFGAGAVKCRTVRLRLADGPFEFGYAVDGCWVPVPGGVTDPLTDFPPEANCLEAYRIDVQTGYGLASAGESAEVIVKVFDHQGLDTIESVTLEAPDLYDGEVELSYSTVSSDGGYLFTGAIENSLSAVVGEHPLLIRVRDAEPDSNLGQIDAWNVAPVNVNEKRGWAVTWGGDAESHGYGIAIDSLGNLYITGDFACGVADFDPGPGIDEHAAVGAGYDAYLTKLDASGTHEWAVTWGNELDYEDMFPKGIAVDKSGHIYVLGVFEGTVDFDPGPGVWELSSGCLFLSKFDTDGNFQWAVRWSAASEGFAVAVDDYGYIYVTGSCNVQMDMDPGPGVDQAMSIGGNNVFLVKLNADSEYQWGRSWGGEGFDAGNALCIASTSVLVGGYATGDTDFDPGPGEYKVDGIQYKDAFLSKFDVNGNFLWARVWGGLGDDKGVQAIATDGYGNMYIAGWYDYTADFDPGPDIVERTPVGEEDAFLSKFAWTGDFQWVCVWGSGWKDGTWDVAADNSKDVWLTGFFSYAVDFDPGPGVDIHDAKTYHRDAFLIKLHSSGEYQWGRSWGGSDGWDEGNGISIDDSGNVFVSGFFFGPADLDPGPGSDIHDSNGAVQGFVSKFPPDGNW